MHHPFAALLFSLVIADSAVNVAHGQLPPPIAEDTVVRVPAQQFDVTRFDSITALSLRAILDSAAAKGLPTRPLINLGLLGAARRAVGSRILAVVRAHAAAMEDVKRIVGPRVSASELDACAQAMRAGVDGGTMALLRAARPTGPLVQPCIVVTDLIQRGVPFATANNAVLSVARLPQSDSMLDSMQSVVAKNAARGGPGMAVEALQRYLRDNVPATARASGTRSRPPDQ